MTSLPLPLAEIGGKVRVGLSGKTAINWFQYEVWLCAACMCVCSTVTGRILSQSAGNMFSKTKTLRIIPSNLNRYQSERLKVDWKKWTLKSYNIKLTLVLLNCLLWDSQYKLPKKKTNYNKNVTKLTQHRSVFFQPSKDKYHFEKRHTGLAAEAPHEELFKRQIHLYILHLAFGSTKTSDESPLR